MSMSSKQMMGQFGGRTNPMNGVHKQVPPSDAPQKPFNVKGDVGLPTGDNGQHGGRDPDDVKGI